MAGPTPLDFGARLRGRMAEAQIGSEALAEKLGVSTPTVWRWRTGRSEPGASQITAIARALGVHVSDLLGESADASTGTEG